MTFIVQSYFDTLLRYVLSVTFCGAVNVVLKVMDQKTLVKPGRSYTVRLTVYIYYKLGEFSRHEFTNLS